MGAELERERQVILHEFIEDEDDARSAAVKLFDKNCYASHALAQPVIGTRSNIERFTRDELMAYMQQQYSGANVIVGVAGVPWFAEGSSGFSAPSFGYILGFIAAAFIVGRIAEQGATRSPMRTAGLMIVGNLVIYAIGVTWLAFALGVDIPTAVALGLTPFLIGDAVKIAAAAGLLPLTWRGLRRAGLTS